MLSTVIPVLSFSMMLLISASFITGARRERKRHEHIGRTQQPTPSTQFHGNPFQALAPRNGRGMSVERPVHHTLCRLSPSWYTHRRTLVSLGLLLMAVLTLFVQSGLADGVLQKLSTSMNVLSDTFQATDVSTAAHMDQLNASQQLVRISQLDPAQYSSSEEYTTWAYSACSAASITEVLNAYGHQYRVTDILHVEAQIGEITPALGLLRPEGIEHTAAQFGFKTTWGNAWSLDQVIESADHGNPVIVSFPPDRYEGGHLLVVTGGNGTTVYLADSSAWNRRSLSRVQFLQWWEGFAAVVTPKERV
ncbi:MAG TPA: C39 family peptidase [Ktedonobacteraceae bacterium]|nr:C39 family peptidase [Ktedonobacteraceae bacterium]